MKKGYFVDRVTGEYLMRGRCTYVAHNLDIDLVLHIFAKAFRCVSGCRSSIAVPMVYAYSCCK